MALIGYDPAKDPKNTANSRANINGRSKVIVPAGQDKNLKRVEGIQTEVDLEYSLFTKQLDSTQQAIWETRKRARVSKAGEEISLFELPAGSLFAVYEVKVLAHVTNGSNPMASFKRVFQVTNGTYGAGTDEDQSFGTNAYSGFHLYGGPSPTFPTSLLRAECAVDTFWVVEIQSQGTASINHKTGLTL